MAARPLLACVAIALASCSGARPAPAPVTAEIARPRVSSGVQRATACATLLPIVVTTENLTGSKGDLCAAVNRSIGVLRDVTGLVPGRFGLRVVLTQLDERSPGSCSIEVELRARSGILVAAHGGAVVARTPGASDRVAARDCLDGVLESTLRGNVRPAMARHLAAP